MIPHHSTRAYAHAHDPSTTSHPLCTRTRVRMRRGLKLGRVNWRHQRNLAYWVANVPGHGGRFGWEMLPMVFGAPPGCQSPTCFKR